MRVSSVKEGRLQLQKDWLSQDVLRVFFLWQNVRALVQLLQLLQPF